MVLSRIDLRNQLRRNEFAPVYVLFGPETYLRDRAAKAIADRVFAPGDFRDFNETSFSLNVEGNLERAIAAADQLPMMSTRRVVRINDVRISPTGYRDTITEDSEPILNRLVSDPPAHATVIFIADDLNGVRKMGKFLRERTAAVEFSRLTDKELEEWAEKECKDSGVSMDSQTLKYLMGRTGPDVLRMTNEIKKLAAASLPSGVIDMELINALGTNNRELNNFELTDHLVAGRHSKAIASLRKMLDDGAEPLALLGLLAYNYRRLLIVKDMMSRGAGRSDIAGHLKMRYSDQEAMFAAARRADLKKLGSAVKRLALTDVAIKSSIGGTGPAGARLQIEMLVCELALM